MPKHKRISPPGFSMFSSMVGVPQSNLDSWKRVAGILGKIWIEFWTNCGSCSNWHITVWIQIVLQAIFTKSRMCDVFYPFNVINSQPISPQEHQRSREVNYLSRNNDISGIWSLVLDTLPKRLLAIASMANNRLGRLGMRRAHQHSSRH